MLRITIPETEFYDEVNEVFINVKEQTLQLEHSLVSVSKWEAKWQKPFLEAKEKTVEETIDYIRCMTITQNVNPLVYLAITDDILQKVCDYMDEPMTAAWFSEEEKGKKSRETVTAEIIYYWMIVHNIPFECRKWHLNQLLVLIRVCNVKNSPPKKLSQAEIMRRNDKLNEARKQRLKTRG